MKKLVLLLIAVMFLLGIGLVVYKQRSGSTPVACTMEAKQCPDGSYVGRVPPSCEFAPCPGESKIKK